MGFTNTARENTVEYRSYLKAEEELKKWKLELAKSNKNLLIIIGSIQNYFPQNKKLKELNKKIEVAMDAYAKLEQTVLNEFGAINQNAQKEAGGIPQEAYMRESEIDATLDLKWAALDEEGRIAILLPKISELQDNFFYKNVELAEGTSDKLKKDRISASEGLDHEIDCLIDEIQKQINEHWWQKFIRPIRHVYRRQD